MQKLYPATLIDKTEQEVRDLAEMQGLSMEEMQEHLDDIRNNESIWMNDVYQVNRREIPRDDGSADDKPMVWLSIKRLDKGPARDWRDFQEIKNQLVGPECEGIELFPAESRLVDTANQYHLWCWSDPEFRVGIGWKERRVSDEMAGGSVQRPRDPDEYDRTDQEDDDHAMDHLENVR